MKVRLSDGVIIMEKTFSKYTSFKNDKDKVKRLENLKDNEYRDCELKFMGLDGTNCINSDDKQVVVEEFLIMILKN